MARGVTLIVVALLQITVGKDLTWFPNSNWGNKANWNLGRLTYENEVADFSQALGNSIIYLDTAVTVRSIILPANGKIVLGTNAAIRFSNQTVTNEGAVTNQVNYFIGARQNWWECAENWRTPGGLPTDTAPCSEDIAIFPADSSFSFVNSNNTVAVNQLILRGIPVTSSVAGNEFLLNVSVKPDCVAEPAKCTCHVVKCSIGNEPVAAGQGASNMVGKAVGPIIGILLLLLLVVTLVIVVTWFCKHTRRTGSYNKEKLEEEMAESPNDSPRQGTFCNPTYDDCAMGTSEDKMVLTGAEVLCNDPDISTSDAGMGAVVVYENPVKDGGMYSGASAPPA